MSLDWREVAVPDLTVTQLYDALRLRAQVFVVEQQCAYADVDGLDLAEGTIHVLGYADHSLVAYARILRSSKAAVHSGASDGLRVGRVIVADSHRGQHLGRRLMQRCLEVCTRAGDGAAVVLSAQAHLVAFYAGLGFEATGEQYLEDGIAHVDMQLTG